MKKVEVIARHHSRHGRDAYLIYPVMTIDGQNVRGPARRQHGAEEAYRRRRHNDRDEEFTWPQRNAVDLETMARDAFGRVDDVHNNVVNEEGQAGGFRQR